VVSFEGLLVLGDEAGNVTFTDSDLRVSIQQKMIGGRIEFDIESDRPLLTRISRRQVSVHRASKTVACTPCTHFHRSFVVSCPHAGPAVLLARSRQSPPLFVVAGPESGGAVVVKTWVGSKLANPANTLDINQLLKVRHIIRIRNAGAQRHSVPSQNFRSTSLASTYDILIGVMSREPTRWR
jgi:hypothetical protein